MCVVKPKHIKTIKKIKNVKTVSQLVIMWKRRKYKQKLHNYHVLMMALRKSELNENICCY